jgi:RNA polymerase sigma factor for flagellar operon FliA
MTTNDLKYKEDELAIHYLPAVKAMAYRLEERLPSSVEFSDLSAIGTEELIKLACRYDEARIASSIYTVMPLYDQLHVGNEGAALAKVEKDLLVDVIKTTLSAYKEREQMIIQLYYFEELTLKEMSNILDITESRISQIHKSVIQKIKESIGA